MEFGQKLDFEISQNFSQHGFVTPKNFFARFARKIFPTRFCHHPADFWMVDCCHHPAFFWMVDSADFWILDGGYHHRHLTVWKCMIWLHHHNPDLSLHRPGIPMGPYSARGKFVTIQYVRMKYPISLTAHNSGTTGPIWALWVSNESLLFDLWIHVISVQLWHSVTEESAVKETEATEFLLLRRMISRLSINKISVASVTLTADSSITECHSHTNIPPI